MIYLKEKCTFKLEPANEDSHVMHTFIHESEKKIFQINTAFKKFSEGNIDKHEFSQILDTATNDIQSEFESAADQSPLIIGIRDKSGELIANKIQRLKSLSRQLAATEPQSGKLK